MLLGALTIEMHTRDPFFPRPAIPFWGFSFAAIAESASCFRSPRWRPSARHGMHECDLQQLIQPIINSLKESMKGLALEDISLPTVE
jgi:hypothetical protein